MSPLLRQPHRGKAPSPPPSPLMLCDRLLTLAQEADRAGYAVTAEQLLQLVEKVFDEKPPPV
jgi:hypothetical protein